MIDFGSNDPALEGSFDLAGLQIPDGTGIAQFQLSVEPVDPIWSAGMQPYGAWQVQPSGNTRVFVRANLGQDVPQDILMVGSANFTPNSFGTTTYASSRLRARFRRLAGSISPYGDADYFWFAAQANRTLSVSATALDQTGAASEQKAQPVTWYLVAGRSAGRFGYRKRAGSEHRFPGRNPAGRFRQRQRQFPHWDR